MKRPALFTFTALTITLLTVLLTTQLATQLKTIQIAHAATPPATAPAAEKSIAIDNFKFTPQQLTIPAGTKVTWTNNDDVPHTATSSDDPPSFDSKTLDTDDKFSFTFTKIGTYKYFCKVHPHMTAAIIVK